MNTELIKESRIKKGLTQIELANKIGLKDGSSISKIEKNGSTSTKSLQRLCEVLDLDFSEVLSET